MFLNNSRSPVYRITAVLICVILTTSCLNIFSTELPPLNTPLPAQSDWVDYGTIFEAGAPGEWDYYLWGGFALSAVKKRDTYFLYYQGASDYRTEFDETVLWRAIGVATSQDGIHFSKYEGNPILTWFPAENGEEGAVSSGLTLGDDGEVFLFYGANTEESAITINADIRVASSSDGLIFNDLGIVLDHKDRSVWGSGDELFSIDAIYDKGLWIIYYIPNGTLQSGKLGVAYGKLLDKLDKSYAVKNGINTLSVWGTAGHAKVGEDVFALILNDVREDRTEIRLMSSRSPNRISAPVVTYQFEGVHQATFLLDEDRRTWFMYYRAVDSLGNIDKYGVKLAPAGEIDATPPSQPQGLRAITANDHRVELIWQPAEDPDTDIVQYLIYRNGELVGSINESRFTDENLSRKTVYSYRVSAVNYHGIEGPMSSPVTETIP